MTAGRPCCGDHILHDDFRRDLAALIGADSLVQRERAALVARRAIWWNCEGRDTARIDDALHAGLLRRLHQMRVPSQLVCRISSGSGAQRR